MNLPEQLEDYLRVHRLTTKKTHLLIACSGGPDSVALTHLLMSLKKKHEFKVSLMYFQHGLRKNAIHEQSFVKRLARHYKIASTVGKWSAHQRASQKRLSLEEAARHARYDFFRKKAVRFRNAKVLLAHTKDDQAETVFMRMIQGTGLRGLSGIRSQLQMGGVTYLRPLLSVTKKELLNYLNSKGHTFCRDESNESKRFLRNRIRLDLLPRIRRTINPRVHDSLARIPEIIAEENELLEDLEKKAWLKLNVRRRRSQLEFSRSLFLKFPVALQFRLLNRALQCLDANSGLNFEAWKRLRTYFKRKQYRHSLPRDIDLVLTPNRVVLYQKKVGAIKKIALKDA